MSTLPALPHIPLEVGENIIDQLSGDVSSLRSCSLTCRGWNHHARYHLMASICIRSREHLYSICDYLSSNPHMLDFVRSLSVSVTDPMGAPYFLDVLPVALLRRLPDLQRYNIVGSYRQRISFHPTTLVHIKSYMLVQELSLYMLEFGTSAELARVLSSLRHLQRLSLVGVEVRTQNMATAIPRLGDKRSPLSEVTVRCPRSSCIVGLLAQMFPSTLRVLRCDLDSLGDPTSLPYLSQLKYLRSLEFVGDLQSFENTCNQIVPVVTNMIPGTLHNLTITFEFKYRGTPAWQSRWNAVGLSLDHAIFASGTPSVMISIMNAKHNRLPVWSKRIQGCFPRLHQGDLLRVQCSSAGLGHDARMSAIAASPCSRYIATGADDGTVIVWNGTASPESMVMEMQRTHPYHDPPRYNGARSLHFSDTGEFLAAMYQHYVVIWRVADGVQLSSHAGPENRVCAWWRHSLDHLMLSVWSYEVHESSSSEYLQVTRAHVHHSSGLITIEPASITSYGVPLAFYPLEYPFIAQSSSGLSFAAWKTHGSQCYIWRTASSTLGYKSHRLDLDYPHTISCASFVGDTQLVLGCRDGTVRWWNMSKSSFPSIAKPCGVLSLYPPASGYMVRTLTSSPLHSFLVAIGQADWEVPVLRRTTAPRCPDGEFAHHVVLRGHGDRVEAACFSPCERYIATTSWDNTIRLWRTRDAELLWTFRDHQYLVRHVVFSSDGRILASADIHGRVCMNLLSRFVRDVLVSSNDDTTVLNARVANLDFLDA